MTAAIRYAPAARQQLNAAAPAELAGIPVRSVPGIGDRIRVVSQRWFDAQAAAFAAGYEFGPLQFETEPTGTGWRLTCTAELRPRT